ncbi:hypothetical protein NliqN6_4070 [Naganishia liquefaciens]|uniref:Uncharacterized protein n=1 Tax=Naganishia liquefaciens TaxID=104408 RepID=A0A8H3YFV4_9TREE|nr:hypothetical protein NliqN6_4070 [Naganishia liquefaciens]
MHGQQANTIQHPPLSPPVSTSEVCYSRKESPVTMSSNMKLVSFADLLDEQLPSPPATFKQIIEAYRREGRGDVETLKAVLAAKQAEEDRIARILEIRITLLQMHAHRLGMVPVSGPSSAARPIRALPGLRNRQRSTSPTNTGTILPAMKLRPEGSYAVHEHVLPPLDRLSSFSSVTSTSGVSERLSLRPRESSSASESERLELPPLSSITSRKRAYATDNEPSAKASGPVYYQSRDKQCLPSPSTDKPSCPMPRERSTSPTTAQVEGTSQKRARTSRSPSDRQGYRNGLELLLNALESPDNAGL